MKTRLLLGAVGVAMGGFGLLRFLQLKLPDIADAVLWLAGGVIVHDAVLAPLTLGAMFVGARLLPSRAKAIVAAGLIVLATVTITAVPVLGSWGARSDNPTLLDRNYVLGWLVFAILVIVSSLVRFTPAWSRLVHRDSTDDGSA